MTFFPSRPRERAAMSYNGKNDVECSTTLATIAQKTLRDGLFYYINCLYYKIVVASLYFDTAALLSFRSCFAPVPL
jgi:hypothetical protein